LAQLEVILFTLTSHFSRSLLLIHALERKPFSLYHISGQRSARSRCAGQVARTRAACAAGCARTVGFAAAAARPSAANMADLANLLGGYGSGSEDDDASMGDAAGASRTACCWPPLCIAAMQCGIVDVVALLKSTKAGRKHLPARTRKGCTGSLAVA
jgi:hypothetical protein